MIVECPECYGENAWYDTDKYYCPNCGHTWNLPGYGDDDFFAGDYEPDEAVCPECPGALKLEWEETEDKWYCDKCDCYYNDKQIGRE